MSDEVKQEPLLTLNGIDYFEADLDENSLKILNMAKFAAQQVNDFNNKLAMAQDHQQKLVNELQTMLEDDSVTIIETEGVKDEPKVTLE